MAIPRISLPDLVSSRQKWPSGLKVPGAAGAGALHETTDFGANPGQLRMFGHVPETLPRAAPLVVVLHGCGQTAAGYDTGTGWSELADRHGFAVLAPEQVGGNNANTCFNWFQPGDTARGQGEAASIRAMIEHMVSRHGLDRGRVFITGLSAGGAMTSVMLAAYPELFAGGAIIAGLPYGTANGLQEALPAMFHPQPRTGAELGDLVRAASQHRGPWPAVSIWHGDADRTVVVQNAEESVKQWLDVHGLAGAQPQRSTVDGVPHSTWRGRNGQPVVESYRVAGLGHGTPIDPAAAEGGVGAPAPYILDAGISSSWRIAQAWGLTGTTIARPAARPAASHSPASHSGASHSAPPRPAAKPAPVAVSGVEGIIEKALRAAGLMGRH